MSGVDIGFIAAAAVLVVLSALLTSAQAAVSAMTRSRAAELVAQGRSGASRLARVVESPARAVNSALLASVACETVAVVLVTRALADAIRPLWLAILVAAVVMIVVSYIALGVAPRTIGRQHAERVALMLSGVIAGLATLLGPLAQGLIAVGNAVTPSKGFREGPFATEAHLREMVDLAEQTRVIESGEREMIHSVFDLGDTLVREVMVPRTDIVFIERYKTLRQALSLALRSGFSRMPVVGEGLDDVVGVAYLKDLTRRVFDNREAESIERVESVMRPCLFVPDSKPADDLMHEMQALRTHVAIVVDEYGGTAGLVTIEDLLEEIVGEITDEYDVEPEAVERVSGGGVRVSSRMPLDELGEVFGAGLEDEDVETVGGLMAKLLGRVPIPGAVVVHEGLRFRAESRAGRRNRVVSVVVEPVETAEGDDVGGRSQPPAADGPDAGAPREAGQR